MIAVRHLGNWLMAFSGVRIWFVSSSPSGVSVSLSLTCTS